MYTYVCCRCKNCSAQIVLEDRGDSDTNLPERPPRPRAGREACSFGLSHCLRDGVWDSETRLLDLASSH
jgi:hypothetical protein